MTISRRIAVGFGSVLLLAAFAIGVGLFSLAKLRGELVAVSTQADDAVLAVEVSGGVDGLLLVTREFIDTRSETSLKAVNSSLDHLREKLADAQSRISQAERAALVDRIEPSLERYAQGFQTLADSMRRRDQLVNEELARIGPQMTQPVAAVISAANQAGDYRVSAMAGALQQHLLLARVALVRYLLELGKDEATVARNELAILQKGLPELAGLLSDAALKQQLDTAAKAVPLYSAAVAEVDQVTRRRDAVKAEVLDVEGGAMTEAALLIADSANADRALQQRHAMADSIRGQIIQAIVSLLVMLVGIVLAVLIARSVRQPLDAITQTMRRLAGGEKGIDIPGTERTDEVGAMAKAVLVFKDSMLEAERLQAEQIAEHAEQAARAERVTNLTRAFDAAANGMVDSVAAAAQQLRATAEHLSDAASRTSSHAETVAAASEQATANVQTVAAATEELTASIREISRQVTQQSSIAAAAADAAASTDGEVQELAVNTQAIGEVVQLITDIAEQTNLLALNATIEAARAGDFGKGFAVVAQEVKNLAGQTSRATDQIARRIATVQAQTGSAVEAIRSIGERVRSMNEIAAAIAAAVEQQSAATAEISRNVTEAAAGTRAVSRTIADVTNEAGRANGASVEVLQAAQSLSDEAGVLRGEVQGFLKGVRAA